MKNTTFSPWFAEQFGMTLVPRSFRGFPSGFAAIKWLDAMASGPCSYYINGHPHPSTFIPEGV